MIYYINESSAPKPEISTNNNETTAIYRHTNKEKSTKKDIFDKMCEEQDYDAADKLVDQVGCDTCKKYKTSKQSAILYLHSKLKDYSYIFKISGSKFFLFELTVIGNKYKYVTFGEEDYTDDQYFSKISD